MPNFYKCHKCHKLFPHKNDYMRHIKRKFPCDLPLKIMPQNSSQNVDIYKCYQCNKTFSRSDNLDRHTAKFCKGKKEDKICEENSTSVFTGIPEHNDDSNFSCQQLIYEHLSEGANRVPTIQPQNSQKTTKSVKLYKCNYCGKYYSRNDSLNRHLDSFCKIKQKSDEQKEEIYNCLLGKMKQLESQNQEILQQNKEQNMKIADLERQLTVTKNKTINNNNNNNNTLTNNTMLTNNNQNILNNNIINNTNKLEVKILAYGKEDICHISDDDYKLILNRGFKSVEELVKQIHFNKNRPENHNIHISNMRDNYVMVFDGNKWLLRNRQATIDDLYDDKKNILVDKFDELIEQLPDHAIKKFKRFLHDEQEDKIANNIKEELKLLLYNNKNINEGMKQKLGLISN